MTVLEVSVHIEADPETIFPYFTDPDRYVQWMGSEATLQPAPGGVYRIQMSDGMANAGEFLEVDGKQDNLFTSRCLKKIGIGQPC